MNIIIFITCAKKSQARKIARNLVRQKLVACVNVVDKIESIFWWQKKIDSAGEVLLIAKSRKSLLARIIRAVKSLHSYEVPEVIALPIIGGNPEYLAWIDAETGTP